MLSRHILEVGVFEAETAAALWRGLGDRPADFLLVDLWAGHYVPVFGRRAGPGTLARARARFGCEEIDAPCPVRQRPRRLSR